MEPRLSLGLPEATKNEAARLQGQWAQPVGTISATTTPVDGIVAHLLEPVPKCEQWLEFRVTALN
jgi:hypothetical protein